MVLVLLILVLLVLVLGLPEGNHPPLLPLRLQRGIVIVGGIGGIVGIGIVGIGIVGIGIIGIGIGGTGIGFASREPTLLFQYPLSAIVIIC